MTDSNRGELPALHLADYALLSRPRPSWSLTQAVQVAWLRYVAVLPERTGRSFYTRDPQATPGPDELRETEFVWALPLRTEDRAGVLLDDEVDFQDRVGVFIWPKAGSGERRVLDKEGSGLVGLLCVLQRPPARDSGAC